MDIVFAHVPTVPDVRGVSVPDFRLFRFVRDRPGAPGDWTELATGYSEDDRAIVRDRSVPTRELDSGMFVTFGARAKARYPRSVVDFSVEDAHRAGMTFLDTPTSVPKALLDFTIGVQDTESGHVTITARAKWNMWRHAPDESRWSDVSDRSATGFQVRGGDTIFAGWRDGSDVYPMVAAHFPAALGTLPVTEDPVSPRSAILRSLIVTSRGWTVPFQPEDAGRDRSGDFVSTQQWRNNLQTLDMLCMAATGRAGWQTAFRTHIATVIVGDEVMGMTDSQRRAAETRLSNAVGDRKKIDNLRSVLGHAMYPLSECEVDRYRQARPTTLTEHPTFSSNGSDFATWASFFDTAERRILQYYTGFAFAGAVEEVDAAEERQHLDVPDRVDALGAALRDAGVFTPSEIDKMTRYMVSIEETNR